MKKHNVEQGTQEWHLLRYGKVTGTTLKSALGSPKVQKTLMYKIVSERMTELVIDEINVAQILRGKEMEPQARQAVSGKTGIEFTETGFLESDDFPGFGISPDAIYEEGGKIVGGLELKCPGSKKHVEYLYENAVPAEYHYQVKAPFIMSDDIQWWYFASYDDRNYELPLFLVKATREDFKDIDEDREKLLAFLRKVDDEHARLTF